MLEGREENTGAGIRGKRGREEVMARNRHEG